MVAVLYRADSFVQCFIPTFELQACFLYVEKSRYTTLFLEIMHLIYITASSFCDSPFICLNKREECILNAPCVTICDTH